MAFHPPTTVAANLRVLSGARTTGTRIVATFYTRFVNGLSKFNPAGEGFSRLHATTRVDPFGIQIGRVLTWISAWLEGPHSEGPARGAE